MEADTEVLLPQTKKYVELSEAGRVQREFATQPLERRLPAKPMISDSRRPELWENTHLWF